MPAKRARTAGGRPRGGVARRRQRVPRSGKYKNQKSLKRKQFVPRAPKAFAHRNMVERAEVTWPLVPGGSPIPAGLTPLLVSVPHECWGNYMRGFDTQQVTSSAIFSRNVTCRLELQPPVKAGAAQAYQFRIVQGYVKRQLVNPLADTSGNTGMNDGIALNFSPTKFEDEALQCCEDFIGVNQGVGSGKGAVDRMQIQVITDSNIVIAPDTTDSAGQTYYPTKVLNYNWATKKTMRLYPFSTDGNIPAVPNLTPINNPGLYIPFIAMFCNNRTDFLGDADRPKFQMTFTHYWDQM